MIRILPSEESGVVIPIFSDNFNEKDFPLEYGWVIHARPICQMDWGEHEVSFEPVLGDDINRDKEYLMSLSSWKTLLELHDLENNEYNISATMSFFNFEYGTHSYVFQILEAKINDINTYFCIYILNVNSDLDEYHNVIEIKNEISPNAAI
jgi:hypothetical protein